MIPIQLYLSGFLSYRAPAELDFTGFDLACISGPNGAGKSSLLDAITWALFGQARKRDDALINSQSDAAEVVLTFAYEGNIYRVLRKKEREKTTLLEFAILQRDTPVSEEDAASLPDEPLWKPLSERTLRETETRIQQVLRLDYETFVNASFFLQGKADQFTQQRPSDRKRILGSILGLEIWEVYRQRAVERRKLVEAEITGIDGRLHEIGAELEEEEQRRQDLKKLEADLQRLSRERSVQEAALDNIRKIVNTLNEQRKLVEALQRQLQAAELSLETLETRAGQRRQEKESFAEILSRAEAIQAGFTAWQAAQAELQRWEEIAGRFRQQEKRREGPRDEINAAGGRLAQELQGLGAQAEQVNAAVSTMQELQEQSEGVQQRIAQAEAQLARRAQLDEQLQEAHKRHAEARAENPRLKSEMDELKERIDELSSAEGALCPLCGQPLSPQDRQALIESLTARGRELGDRFRANLTLLRQAESRVQELETEIADLAKEESELRSSAQSLAQLASRLEVLQSQRRAWEEQGAPRLEQVRTALEQESYAPEARQRLRQIDEELKAIGYDAAAHDAARQAELQGRESQEQLRALERAQAALAPLERELDNLEQEIAAQRQTVARQRAEYDQAAASLAAAQASAPDLESAERSLFDLQEQENHLRLQVGAARQKVLVLADLKTRRNSLEAQREECAQAVRQYRQLERAFGKDGVPALLIEQALPQIETKANEILERLSGGTMSIRFVTQAAFKDKHRDDLKETLDIQISDGAGMRDYEMFSGGEAFRVNFAVRLALSEVLAQRAGARLQTLVIDEGFGSQDALGRQRLIEAINMVRQDFSKILVITHIDELKDAFPTRIEVEKTPDGSTLQVI